VPLGIAAWVLSRRHLVESRSPGRRRLPDLPGALAFALAVSALVLGVTQGEEWGWTSTGVLACVAATVAGLALVAWRSTWHRSPVVDLGLLRIRTFTVANAMSLVSAAGFYGYTLANILFLTEVWGYSVLEAGLAITPGPFVAAAVAGPASRLAVRVGHRAVLAAGGLLWGAAVLWLVTRVGTAPAFAGEWLPATVLLGIGAGITLPNLAGAAIGAAPGESFATATGLNSVARQVGAALGVALVVAILGTPSPLEAAGAFDRAWLFAAACLGATGLGCLALGVVPRGQAPALAGAARVLLGSVPSPDDRPRRAAALRSPLAPAATAPGAPETPAEFLARVPVLAGLPSTVLEALDAESEVLGLRAGEWLFRQGDAGDAMYVVRAGRLDVVDEETGGILRVLGRGAALGELSLLTSAPRSAGVRAARRSEVLAIARATFERLMVATPEGSLALARGLGLQLRDSRPAPRAVRPVPVTVALLPGRAAARSVLEDPPAVLREAAG
jgi:CRP-like cAMP-binding protein